MWTIKNIFLGSLLQNKSLNQFTVHQAKAEKKQHISPKLINNLFKTPTLCTLRLESVRLFNVSSLAQQDCIDQT